MNDKEDGNGRNNIFKFRPHARFPTLALAALVVIVYYRTVCWRMHYLDFIYVDGLLAVKSEAVRIIR